MEHVGPACIPYESGKKMFCLYRKQWHSAHFGRIIRKYCQFKILTKPHICYEKKKSISKINYLVT